MSHYVKRDAQGLVIAVSVEPLEGFEPAQGSASELADEMDARRGQPQNRLAESDRDVVRVLDDLINLLVETNAIRFTDLPEPAQRKLMERKGLRRGGTHLGLLGEDSSLI
jgi:hypothetical protein